MIVIATHNGKQYVLDLLEDIKKTPSIENEHVLVLDTGSSSYDPKTLFNEINDRKYKFKITTDITPYKGYDSGAYIYAYHKYIDTEYIFIQDSIRIRHERWNTYFKISSEEIIAWATHPIIYDTYTQKNWVKNKIYDYKEPQNLIFGPIFSISKKTLAEFDKKYGLANFIPRNKEQACGMERGWAALASSCNKKLKSVEPLVPFGVSLKEKLNKNNESILIKTWGNRK